jgi:hypothetical protein
MKHKKPMVSGKQQEKEKVVYKLENKSNCYCLQIHNLIHRNLSKLHQNLLKLINEFRKVPEYTINI